MEDPPPADAPTALPEKPRRKFPLAILGAIIPIVVALWLVFGRGPSRFQGDTFDANVVLITADTLRADHLGAYRSTRARTPVIDSLADAGILFESAFTPAVVTLPSHASILTGTFPATHGIHDNGDYRLSASALTLAEVLRSRGLRTGAVVGSFVLDSMFGLDQGFESYDDSLPAQQANQTFFAERPASSVTDAALRFVKGAQGERFFLWAHYFDPHHPYAAPPEFRGQHPGRPYDAEVSYMDSEIGRLMGGLQDLGVRPKTLVVFVADHGEGLGDHGEDSHGIFLYDETIRVPLIFSFPPHLPEGRRIPQTVRTVDILPTILELLRIDPRESAAVAQGSSLWPLIADEKGSEPGYPVYAEAMEPLLLYGWSPLEVVRDAAFKYIEAPRPELYDLTADPGERNNLASSRPEVAAAYHARLESLRREITREGAAADPVSPDPETAAKLRSLGYAGPGRTAGKLGRLTSAPGERLDDPKDKVGMLARINRVYAAFGSGQHDLAVTEAQAVLAEDADNASVRFYLAAALAQSNRCTEALTEYRILVDRSPNDTEALSNVGWCLTTLERFDEAASVFTRVLEIFPDHIHARASLANVAFARGDYKEAVRLYKETLRLEPNHMASIMTLAGILEASGRTDEAATFYTHATTVDPSRVDAWMSLGWVRLAQGKQDEALAALRRAEALEPQAAEVQIAMGDVLLAMGKVPEAQDAYKMGVKVAPSNASGWYGLGRIEAAKGDPMLGAKLIHRAMSLNPERLDWAEDLARALAKAGQGRAAVMELERYLASGKVPPDRRTQVMKDLEAYRAL